MDNEFNAIFLRDKDSIQHYGVGHDKGGHSGRYPWGSGEDDYQHSIDFLGRIEKLKKSGWKETPENIMEEFGMNSKEYRIEKSLCNDERRYANVTRAVNLKNSGMTATQIGKEMGVNESTVRGWLDDERNTKLAITRETAEHLKSRVNELGMMDVGKNYELELGVSKEKLDTALYYLESQGYKIFVGRVPQALNQNQMTTLRVLATPDKEWKEMYDFDNIKTDKEYVSQNDGESFEKKFTYPTSIDGRRVKVLTAHEIGPDGEEGVAKDGLIQIRRGVQDLDLGDSKYCQVRILVDNDKYLKGMAVYSDNIPEGYDIVFNSNKKTREDAFKKIKDDPDNPFGSAIKDADQGGQYWYIDKNDGKKKLGAINKRADEGDWSEWANKLPSQFLSKQSEQMAKKQLNLAKADKEEEFDEIMSLTNPTIKKYYLKKFADGCDRDAVDLKAAALPGQKYHAIIPINSLGDQEIYAPNYKDGTKLALIRYPHGGTFEIPVLTVNNKNRTAIGILGTTSIDAVGINKKVADQLSGADFDGDTVMCIPTHDSQGKVKIANRKPLKELVDFDPKYDYGTEKKIGKDGKEHYYRNGKEVSIMKNTQVQMGVISNLITDMTLSGGASDDELARAVKHSMVVIDAEKHKLDWKASEVDNNIDDLKRKYQPKYNSKGELVSYGGAGTIISRAKHEVQVDKRRGEAKINIEYTTAKNQKGKDWYDPSKPEGAIVKKKNKWYDPTRPEGALIYTKADDKDLYYADNKYNRDTKTMTITKTDGKKISYSVENRKDVDYYKPVMKKDKKTGEVYFTNKDESIRYKTKKRTFGTEIMKEVDDAYDLLSNKAHPNPMEIIYADYANHMKALANKARVEYIKTGNQKYDKKSNEIYKNEVDSILEKLNIAKKNSNIERHAQRLQAAELKKRKIADPSLKGENLRKVAQRLITKYREQLGGKTRKERNIKITDKEWEAIQAGAITETKLKEILSNSDPDSLRQKAMPKAKIEPNVSQINLMKTMSNSNFTLQQIADRTGFSPSTIAKYLKGGK